MYIATYAYVCEYGINVRAYVCEHRIKVASYTQFHLKCRIANTSRVKLAVSSNTAQS